MQGRKPLAWLLSLTLLVMLFPVGLSHAVAAGDLDWSGATDGSLGQYMAADAVPAGSLLVGKTPAVGTTDTLWEVKSGGPTADKLTDGAFCTNNSTGRVVYELRRQDYNSGSWAPFTFALDESVKLGYFLIGSETGAAQYLTDVRVYVSEELDTLYEDANKVAEATGVSLGNYFIRGEVKTGRYVGFAFRNPCGYWSAPWYGEIRFGELAAYPDPGAGDDTPREPDWTDATVVTKGWVKATDALESGSLISGRTPTQGVTEEAWEPYNSQLSWITDGRLVLADNSNRVQLDLNPSVPAGQWAQLTFDTGVVAQFTHFLIGSEYGAAQYLTNVKIYVSEERATLYSDSHLVAEATGVSLGNYYIRGDVREGQYVGFAFQNPGGFWSAPWYGLLRIGELGAYGTVDEDQSAWNTADKGMYKAVSEPESGSLISGKTPTKGASEEAWTTYNSQLSQITDGNLVLADNSNRVQLELNPSVPAGQWAQLTFDTGVVAQFTHFLIGSEYGAAQYLSKVKVYVSFDRTELYAEKNLVAAASGVTVGNYLLKGQAAYGRYVGFAFQNPGGFWSAPWYGLLRIGELAAYGTASPEEPTAGVRLNDTEDAGKLPAGNNLLQGLTPKDINGIPIAAETPVSNSTDGIILGITQPQEKPHTGTNNGMTFEKTEGNYLVYDLGVDARMEQILLAANAWDLESYWVYEADIFIGDTLVELAEQPSVYVNFRHSIGVVLELPENTVGRYIAFRIPVQSHWYSRVRIGEIGVYGTLLGNPGDSSSVVNLLAGQQAMETYICERGKPDLYHEERSGYLNRFAWEDPEERLTDGLYTTRSTWYNHAADGRQHGNYIDVSSPWSVLIYYLGGPADIHEILLTSTAEKGLYLGGADFYVAMDLEHLFDEDNRVFTSGGEKTVTNEDGLVLLDPAYDVHQRCMRVTFDHARKGRYVAIVVTRAHASDVLGYGVCRVNEIEVFGSLPEELREVFPETTFRDAHTGYSLTLNPYNNDDTAIFSAIDHLEVVRTACPASLAATVRDSWLKVDPSDLSVYEFRLIKRDGSLMTQAEYGSRRVDVCMTNESGHMQGLGAVVGDTVVRVVNSRTDSEKRLIGENVPSLKLVRLIYRDDLVVRSGVAGGHYADAVAGAMDAPAPWAEDLRRYGWIAWPVGLSLAAGGVWVFCRRRKAKGGKAE